MLAERLVAILSMQNYYFLYFGSYKIDINATIDISRGVDSFIDVL
jgi:hypothetical protein